VVLTSQRGSWPRSARRSSSTAVTPHSNGTRTRCRGSSRTFWRLLPEPRAPQRHEEAIGL